MHLMRVVIQIRNATFYISSVVGGRGIAHIFQWYQFSLPLTSIVSLPVWLIAFSHFDLDPIHTMDAEALRALTFRQLCVLLFLCIKEFLSRFEIEYECTNPFTVLGS